MGLMGVIFPVEFGGAGLGYVDYALAVEELSALMARSGSSWPRTTRSAPTTLSCRQRSAERKYIPKLASGEWLGAWGLTEPGSGSDAGSAAHDRRARRRPLGAERQQDIHHQRTLRRYLRRAWRSPIKIQGTHGISAFMVEKGHSGFRPGKKENKLGLRASDTVGTDF